MVVLATYAIRTAPKEPAVRQGKGKRRAMLTRLRFDQ